MPTPIPTLLTLPSLNGYKITTIKNNSQESIKTLIKSIISSNSNQNDPFYVLDLGTVVDLYQTWTQHLSIARPFFAVKCNPDPALIGTLAALGAGFDCASPAEMESVLAVGVTADRIVYANACKAEPHIKYARTVGIGLTTFDSVYELEKMRLHHPDCELLLRIKPPVNTGVRRSLETKYGAFPEEMEPLLRAAQSMKLSVVGVSFHIGTSATVFETFDAAIESARSVFDITEKINSPKMNILNVGGGFTAGKLFEKAAKSIKSSIKTHFDDYPNLKVIAEPGRYFAETTATLATCIIGKRIRGEKREYWINDGIYGSMNCIKMNVVNVSMLPLDDEKFKGTKEYKSTVFGPTCDALDVVASDLQLPEMEVGDWMVSPNMGAYAKAMGSMFNGFSTMGIQVHLANSLNWL